MRTSPESPPQVLSTLIVLLGATAIVAALFHALHANPWWMQVTVARNGDVAFEGVVLGPGDAPTVRALLEEHVVDNMQRSDHCMLERGCGPDGVDVLIDPDAPRAAVDAVTAVVARHGPLALRRSSRRVGEQTR